MEIGKILPGKRQLKFQFAVAWLARHSLGGAAAVNKLICTRVNYFMNYVSTARIHWAMQRCHIPSPIWFTLPLSILRSLSPSDKFVECRIALQPELITRSSALFSASLFSRAPARVIRHSPRLGRLNQMNRRHLQFQFRPWNDWHHFTGKQKQQRQFKKKTKKKTK